jgi:hypothetical protein
MTELLLRDCSTCGDQRRFEAPDCADGHGPDCPDLACVECGTAIFVGILSSQLSMWSETFHRVAPAA